MLVIRDVKGLDDIDYRSPINLSLVCYGFRYKTKEGVAKRFLWRDVADTELLILDTVHCIEEYLTLAEFQSKGYAASDFGRYIIPKHLDFIAKYADDFDVFMLFLTCMFDGDWHTVDGSYVVFEKRSFLFHCSHEELLGKLAKFKVLFL